jgi:hypothetical protein
MNINTNLLHAHILRRTRSFQGVVEKGDVHKNLGVMRKT